MKTIQCLCGLLLVLSPSCMPLAAGMYTFGDGLSHAHDRDKDALSEEGRDSESQEGEGGRACSSDYNCGYGNICVKEAYHFSGICVKEAYHFSGICGRAVDAYGVPTLQAPRPDSIGAGEDVCQFDTQCPIGFHCTGGHCWR